MPISTTQSLSILPSTQSSGGSLKEKANKLRYDSRTSDDASLWSTAAEALSNAQSQIDSITGALRSPLPQAQLIQITDPSGNLIAEVGNMQGDNNQAYQGLWGKNLYVGGSGPDTAPFFVDSRGSGDQVFVVDPLGNVGAWLGNQTELPKTITNVLACTNPPWPAQYAGFVQIHIVAHGYTSGDNVAIDGVVGVPNANVSMGIIRVLDADNFVLLQTPFSGAYVSGGECSRFYSGGLFAALAIGGSQVITNIQNSAGLIQVTVPNHGYHTGYAVIITDTTGIPGLNYVSWNVTVIDANNFTLNGSVFAGAYDGLGGQCLNWPTAKLIAYDNGDVLINGATIIIDSNGITTEIANAPVGGVPSSPATSLISIDNATGAQLYIDPFAVVMQNANGNYTVNLFQTTTGSSLLLTEASGLPFHASTASLVATAAQTELNLFQSTSSSNGKNSLLTPPQLEFTQSAAGGNDSIYGLAGISITNGADVLTATQATVTLTNGVATVTILAASVDSPLFSVGGVTVIDGSRNITGATINATSGFEANGTPGLSVARSFGTSLSVATDATGVAGTPGTGQHAITVVTGVSLNLTANTFSEGLLTV